jgi:hypothetical protein
MFRVSRKGQGIDDADTIEGARRIVERQLPGRYDVDEIRGDPFPSGHTSRQWGRMIRHPDGRVEDEPWPWERAGVLDRFGPQIRASGGSVGRGAIGLVGAAESREGSLTGQELGPYSDRMLRCRRTNGASFKSKGVHMTINRRNRGYDHPANRPF